MNRRTMLTTSVAGLALVLVAATAVSAPKAKFNKRQLVGSWTLISASAPNPSVEPFGVDDGFAAFQSNGHFALSLIRSNLPKFASNNRANGSSDENKSIVQGSIAYFGTYTLDPADGTLTLHIDRSSFPNWNGTDIKRMITSLTTQELKYTNPAASVGGSAELAWKKVK
jgi:Lipocalin-like domain